MSANDDLPPEGKIVTGHPVDTKRHPGEDASDEDRRLWASEFAESLLEAARQMADIAQAPTGDASLALIIAAGRLSGWVGHKDGCCVTHVLENATKDRENFDVAVVQGFRHAVEDAGDAGKRIGDREHATTH